MSRLQRHATQSPLIASLYIQAIRQGQSLWFRVASNSMMPILRRDDKVYIEPAQAHEIQIGDIAAFETPRGLTIHRIVRVQQLGKTTRLLQMADVELLTDWIEASAVLGLVVKMRRQTRQLNLRHPIAKWCGSVIARLRYQFYKYTKTSPLRTVVHRPSRLVVYLGYWCIRCFCTTPATKEETF